MEKTLVIYDPDTLYGERLMQYVNEKAERYGLCALAISGECIRGTLAGDSNGFVIV